jgi:2-iminobutanoate/2-iminopropanoate deaminase
MLRSLTLSLIAFLACSSLVFAEKKAVNPPEIPPSKSPFSTGILSGDTLYISGQIGTDPKTNKIPDSFDDEAKLCLEKIGYVLKAGGFTFADVVSVQVFLTDTDLFPRMNAIYATYFPEPRPARATVGVNKLVVAGAHIEIAVTARH